MMLPEPLQPLAAWPQFVVWRAVWNERRQKWDKLPYSPRTGAMASSVDPETWVTYAEAAQAKGYDGIGFVFTAADPFWFLDIDDAYADGQWSPLAQELCARLAGAAVEVSHSGTGLHLIGSGTVPEHGCRNNSLHLDFFTEERFVALTFSNLSGSAATDKTADISAIAVQYFPPSEHTIAEDWTTEPCEAWAGPEDDAELLQRALASGGKATAASAFGGGTQDVTFAHLFAADADVLGAKWPADRAGEPYNASSADQALANALAFWTGKNCERIERIMRLSALARAKWDDRPDWLQTTILKACGFVQQVYVERAARAAVPPPPPLAAEDAKAAGFDARLDGGLMLSHQQLEHFAGCIYIQNLNKVLTPRGELLDQSRFNVRFGGYEFVHSVDGKKTTPNAWTAYTENQAFRPVMADRICFRPEVAQDLVTDAGMILANTYRAHEADDLEGDASPFLNHMRRMFPNGDDYEKLVSYMASVVQNPGVKAQWWPVVQGAEGNFKSFLLLIMAHAVGQHYAHMPNMEKMVRGGSNFNGWIERKLFLGLDEVYAANRREFFEGFKTTVTNRFIPIEGKGLEEVTGDNRANGMIVTNHKDGVPISGHNRRFAAFFAAQQSPEDMLRDGMDAAYIANLKDWLMGLGAHAALGVNAGIRMVVHHLRTRAVLPQHDISKLSIRCPETTSTATALSASLGLAEQVIQEAIGEERVGFSGGWVSSIWLDRFLEGRRIRLPNSKRREVMQSIGYDYHPALGEHGRVNNITSPDDGKPRLYIRKGHISANIESPAEAAKAYTKAQDKAACANDTARQKEGG